MSIWQKSGEKLEFSNINLPFFPRIWRLRVGTENEDQHWHYVYFDIPIEGPHYLSVETKMRLLWKKSPVGVGISMSFLDEQKKRVEFLEERCTEPTDAFVPVILFGKPPENTSYIRISIYIHNAGEMEFLSPVVCTPWSENNDERRRVFLRSTDDPYHRRLLGFGVEDDGRFYDMNNRKGGVDEHAITIRRERIQFLRPHWVRTFIWFKDWYSDGGNLASQPLENDGIKSLYESWCDYKDLNTEMNLTMVTWGMDKPWDDVDKRVAELLKILIFLKNGEYGKQIRYFTLTNEPNYFFDVQTGNRFLVFIEYHKRLKEMFENRQVRLKFIGSDDAMGMDWFWSCISDNEYSELTDVWASHFYIHYTSVPFTREILKNRLDLLAECGQSKKPFVITELGITDNRFLAPAENPIMKEYAGALYTVAFIIDALNVGVNGFSIWCLQEVRYPGLSEPMRIGLWGYADVQWKLYPIFYALAMFTRNTSRGDEIIPLETTNPFFVKGVRINNHLFWCNLQSDETVLVVPQEMRAIAGKVYYNDTEEKEAIKEKTVEINSNEFVLPPMSFGYFELDK